MDGGKLLIISAPSGSGKSTLVKYLMTKVHKLAFSVSATNRPPRGEEKDGVDYHFLTTADFQKKIAEKAFVEWEEVYEGRYYGTLMSEVEHIRSLGFTVVFDVDVIGGLNIKKMYGDEALSVFIQPPSIAVLKSRLENRKTDSPQDIENRLGKAQAEMTYAPQFDITILNDNLNEAQEKLVAAVKQFL
ncbi:MAG: guanylate kinase [Salinivirgaceae bacterium]|jgi:guanylate kinase|nr:guanylate kinase [Salinivirgaceae bacterium]